MKSVLYRSFIFILGFCIVDLLLFGLLILGFTYFRSEEYVQAKKYPESELLILGSSHAGEGFDTAKIRQHTGLSAYNFGRGRRNVEYTNYLSRFLIREGKKPSVVILVATYHDLTEQTHPYMILPFAASNEERYKLSLSFLAQRSWIPGRSFFYSDRYSSSVRMLLSRSLSWLKNQQRDVPWRDTPDRGFNALHSSLEEKVRPKHFARFPYYYEHKKLQLLKSTIRLWKSTGALVILTDPPEYIGTLLSRSEYPQYEKLMQQTAEECGALFKSFNTSSWKPLHDAQNFKDGGWGHPNSHLNRKGAALFTPHFSQWLKPLLNTRP